MTEYWDTELKACPFCGNEVEIFRDDEELIPQGIHCPVCSYKLKFMQVKIKCNQSDAEIIKHIAEYWNRRNGQGHLIGNLKDCPFCGHKVHLTADYGSETRGTFCGWCSWILHFPKGTMTRAEIIDVWNRRAVNES